jgi:hypothetical protein
LNGVETPMASHHKIQGFCKNLLREILVSQIISCLATSYNLLINILGSEKIQFENNL